jgi:hypothetical protein
MADTTAWSDLIEVYSGLKDTEERNLSILRATLKALNASDATLAQRRSALDMMNTAWNFLRNAHVTIPEDLQTAQDELDTFVQLAEHHMVGASLDSLRDTARHMVNRSKAGKSM